MLNARSGAIDDFCHWGSSDFFYINCSLSQRPTFKVLRITYLVGEIKFKLLFHCPLTEWDWFCLLCFTYFCNFLGLVLRYFWFLTFFLRRCKPICTSPSWWIFSEKVPRLPCGGGRRPPCAIAFSCALVKIVSHGGSNHESLNHYSVRLL